MSKNKKLNNSGTIFFAYQSKDKSKDSNNIDAIKAFKKTYGDRAITWESMKSNGKLINRQILSSIDAAETFACDMSYLNYNVLFELGYAIGKKKPLLILLNSSINDALKNYTSIPVLKGLGYSLFNNAEDILKAITSIDKSSVLIQQLDRLVENEKNTHEIFYIKSSCNTQADLSALDYIKETYNNSIIDEPDEIAYQTLEWYLSSINKCQMMIVHLVSQSNINANTYNSRNSFFAGIGLALGKKVLLVSPITNSIPIDYDEICVQYNDSEDCVNNIDNWIKRRKKKLSPISPKINKFDHETSLLMLGIGYSVAEHEKDQLMHYFVPTYAFNEAKKRNSLIFYGRKGTGKTAIYYKLLDEFDDQDTVLTIQLKPESSDLIENIRASKIFKDSITRSTIFNTIWKLILSSQLLTILYEMTIKKKREINLPEEDDLIKFYLSNKLIQGNFFKTASFFNEIIPNYDGSVEKTIENLNQKYLIPLMAITKKYMKRNKYIKLVILADNLDKAWVLDNDLLLQTEMILSLLQVSGEFQNDLYDKNNPSNTNVCCIIFLRDDIYRFVCNKAREPDKIETMAYKIDWSSYRPMLKLLVEKRMKYVLELDQEEDIINLWDEYFDIGNDAFALVDNTCLPRPRDVLIFFSKMFESACNNNRSKVCFEDYLYACEYYNQFLIYNLIAENSVEFPYISALISEINEKISIVINIKIFKDIITKYTNDEKNISKIINSLFVNKIIIGSNNFDDKKYTSYDEIENAQISKKGFLKKFYISKYQLAEAIKSSPSPKASL